MRKVPHKPFEIWLKQQNTHDRMQPVVGTALDAYLIKLRVYHTLKPTLWQRLKGWK
ncbi:MULTISPECIES: hypothetical protein [Lactiplantibacillus]|uniref:Transposase n=1 Tax=Lactiplantibacillus argentoratensis TaxID=271881 RepID=A0ABS5UGH1_9LACO|nr:MULTISPECIES: hypothetical protein [Lactiplantibacillus]MBT1137676.1 hypothetical protein [Lactiplantibacillus argentoratensis]MBT1140534.1 hypothetical protein [Lactiplantibacillus argentoratensis]UWF30271.1 hypothetical protein NYR27_09515 [Lactiplantibacillus plantarum]UWF40289.1 hypothetical protein NYR28_05990 [Lactiplantibacillus plantarum]UWF43288.1 hypothetical protein NYR31_06000 [Lactiplantibacillus plantarum]